MSEATRKLRRKDLHLKDPDEFVTLTTRAVDWAKANRNAVTAAAAAAAALLLVVAGWRWFAASRVERSATRFYAANELFRREQWDQAQKDFDDLAAALPGTAYGRLARLYAGRAALQAGRRPEAATRLQGFLADPLGDPALEQIARVNLAAALSADGKADDARREATRAVEMAGPARPEATIELARVEEAAGARERAIELYQGYLKDQPNGPVRDFARARIVALGGTPPPAAPDPRMPQISQPQIEIQPAQ